jgi:uncharacterized membrane protein (GlpM family)
MLNPIFWWNLLFAFIVGGITITFATIMGDKFGSKIGGFVIGLPTTVFVAFLFIGISQGADVASQAAIVFPISVSIGALFVVGVAYFSKKKFLTGFLAGLLIWLILASILLISNVQHLITSLILFVTILIFSHYILFKKIKFKKEKFSKKKLTKKEIIIRAIFSGIVVSLAVFLSKIGGPIFGGLFAAFPAGFISSLVIANKSQGPDFARSMCKSMMVSGMINTTAYAMLVRILYPKIGILYGTILSYLIIIPIAILTYKYLKKR